MTCQMQRKGGENSGYANTCQSRHPEGFNKVFSELQACQIQEVLMMPRTNQMSISGFSCQINFLHNLNHLKTIDFNDVQNKPFYCINEQLGS